MLSQWLYIGIFVIVSLLLPTIAIVLARILSPKKPNPIKNSVYECGMETYGTAWVQFRIQYYVYALVFLIFDVEAIFLYPVAVAYNQVTLFAVIEAIIFLLILLGGFFYIWKKDALTWQ